MIDTTQDTWIPWAKPHNISEVSNTYMWNEKKLLVRTFTVKHIDLMTQFTKFIDTMDFRILVPRRSYNNQSEGYRNISTMLPVNHALWDCSVRFQTGMKLWSDTK